MDTINYSIDLWKHKNENLKEFKLYFLDLMYELMREGWQHDVEGWHKWDGKKFQTISHKYLDDLAWQRVKANLSKGDRYA